MATKLFVPGLGQVVIPDEVPLEDTRKYIEGIAQQRKVELPPADLGIAPEREGTAGPIEALIGGTKRLLSSQLTAAASPFTGATEAAVSGLERQRAIEERPATSLEELKRRYEEEGFFPAVGEALSQFPGAVAENLPIIGEMAAGARIGATVTPPVLPFVGPFAKPIGAAIGAAAGPVLSAYGAGAERQVAEQIKRGEAPEVDVEKAALAAVPSAALDVIEGRIAFGRGIIGKLLGKTDDEIAAASKSATEKELRKLADEGILGSIARGTTRTAAFEMPAEIAQQALERWQAGLPLTGDEAYKEYAEAAYGAGLVSPIGAVGRLSERGLAREEAGRREALEAFERDTPDVRQLMVPAELNIAPESVGAKTEEFLGKIDRAIPTFNLSNIVAQTGDEVVNEGDATLIANELLRRGEIIQSGGTEESPEFRFLSDEERIVPTLTADKPYFYATPVTKEVYSEPEGYEVYNQAINVSRKARTEEEAERIKTAMDARVKRMTTDIDKEIKGLEDNLLLIQEGLDIAAASNMPDEQLAEEYDKADLQQKETQVKLDALKTQKEVISGARTEVTALGMKPVEEKGYEVRLYRPGQSAKTLAPFATREEAEQFIVQNAPGEQQRSIFEDTAPSRESIREAQKRLYPQLSEEKPADSEKPVEAATEAAQPEVAPAPTPEMQQRIQAVTSRLRGHLDQMGLKNVGINVADKLEAMVNGQVTPIDGFYLDRVVNASLSSKRGVLSTFGHETVHAMREMGLFSDKEWNILSKKAKDEWLGKYSVPERYNNLNEEEQIEEAIADAFGEWMGGEYKPTGVIRGLLNRMKMFLESVGSVFRGQGFDNTEKIFQRAMRGELKGGVERKAEGAKFALPQTINVDGVERSTINSEGRPIHPTEEGVRNFWKWFGESKVVDAEGKPIVVYTGTSKDKDFDKFNVPKNGAWFSKNKEVASQYAIENDSQNEKYIPGRGFVKYNTASRVIPAYLKITNPANFQQISEQDNDLLRNALNYKKAQSQVFEKLKQEGFDGYDEGDGVWVAIKDPTQIKSAAGNIGTFGPTEKRIQYAVALDDFNNLSPESQRVLEEDFLYSPLNRFIFNAPKKLEGQSAVNWLQWLKANEQNYGGKQGELFWTGLDDWLTNQGKNKVSQEQIVQYLKDFDNPRDVVYEAAGRPEIGVMDVTDQLPELVDPMGDPVDAAYEFIVTVGGNDFSFVAYERKSDEPYSLHLYDVNNDFVNSFDSIDGVKQELGYEANESLGAQGNTKFSEWTLDGGDNYREIPVVLSGPAAKKVVFDFYGTHWPDANVIYHLRTNDRQDIDGNNVLFVEEVQSDWAQAGRDYGFYDVETKKEKIKENKAKIDELDEKFSDLEILLGDLAAEEDDLFERKDRAQDRSLIKYLNDQIKKNKIEVKKIEEEFKNLEKEKEKLSKFKYSPFGPYVQDTSKWVELAAKRIIAMAVSGGYDKVAFINPAQAHYRFPEKSDGGSTKEGFENFYGKILPNKLNSLLQKYGSKVEVMQLPVIGDADKWVVDTDGSKPLVTWAGDNIISQQLGFNVTPELAASVRQRGFPKLALPLKVTAQGEKRPTLNANGLQIHPTKSGVRNFWRWFGDGQLVDSVGRPRLFYHGSLKDLERFKTGTADAIFFAPNPGPMQTFINYKVTQAQIGLGGMTNAGVVYPVYLNAKNVFDYENPEHVDAVVKEVMKGAKGKVFGIGKKVLLRPYYSVKTPTAEGVEEEFFVAPESVVKPLKYSEDGLRDHLADGYWPAFETGEVIDAIKKLGFDSFMVQENFGGQFYKNVAVFSPNQIKSAVGNNGLFEPQDPRIQYALQRPKNQIANAIRAASKPINPRQDPLFNTPFRNPKAGINVFNKGILDTPVVPKNKGPIRRFLMNYGSKGLQFFQLSGLADIFGDSLPIRPYYNAVRHMMGARDVYIHESTEISERWQRLNARSLQDGNNMATVMNRATFYRYDPSKDSGNKNQRAPKTAEEIEIQRMFDALPDPYKKLYVDVRNFYKKRFEEFFKLLEQRVRKSVTNEERANQVIEELKKKYNYYNTIEPYFPLTRFGEYWVRYTEAGQTKFEMFENASDQDTFRTKIMSDPNITNIEVGKKISDLQGELGASDFVGKIMQSLDEAKGGFMGQAQVDDLKDSVWQLYLQNLPELSMRKQFLHRANVPGFSNDALRAFQKNSFHGAYHMARLQFSPEVYEKLNDIRRAVIQMQKTNHPDAVPMTEVFESINGEQRQKQIWRPDDTSAPFRILGQVGFLYYLSTAASAVTNLSQNFTHAFPIMGSQFGYDKATKEFSRAYKQFFESPSLDDFSDITRSKSATETALQADKGIRSIFDITRTLKQLQDEAKTPDEKEKYGREIDAINYLYQTVIARSQAMDLAGATDRVTMSSNPLQVGMRFVAMAFHGAEILNRTTTGIVAYRLQMEKLAKEQPGMSVEERHQQAIQRASEIVDQSHYNYSEANRSEFMGKFGNFGKVVFMFKSYAVAETTFLLNAFRVWSKVLRARWAGTPLEQKAIDDSKQAGRMLLGVMGMQATFAGVLGLPTPLLMIVMGLTNMLGLGDDDEEKDVPAEIKFKQWLAETFGDNLSQAVAYGPLSYVTGADFNSRIGLNQLWFRDPNPAEDELDQTKNFFLSLGGPIVGLGTNFMQGLVMMQQGQVERGMEKMVPNIIKSPLQAQRFAEEGATTAKGDVILDELTTSEQAVTFFGFTPIRLSLEYKQQSEMRGAMFKANLAKKRILIRFNLATKSGDVDALEDIQEDIQDYNEKYPTDPITYDTLKRSLKARRAAEKETVKGLRIPKRQRAITEGVSWLNTEDED